MSAKVYTVIRGLELQVDRYGLATNFAPAIVPDEVAEQLAREIAGDPAHPEADDPRSKHYGRTGVPGRKDIHIEVTRYDTKGEVAEVLTAGPARLTPPSPVASGEPGQEVADDPAAPRLDPTTGIGDPHEWTVAVNETAEPVEGDGHEKE